MELVQVSFFVRASIHICGPEIKIRPLLKRLAHLMSCHCLHGLEWTPEGYQLLSRALYIELKDRHVFMRWRSERNAHGGDHYAEILVKGISGIPVVTRSKSRIIKDLNERCKLISPSNQVARIKYSVTFRTLEFLESKWEKAISSGYVEHLPLCDKRWPSLWKTMIQEPTRQEFSALEALVPSKEEKEKIEARTEPKYLGFIPKTMVSDVKASVSSVMGRITPF
uniref:Uncharacterized protein n=1 Tax=Blattodean rhabdo-related virus OKIAV14 TaxID=2746364 RepID=A0A7D7JQ75_9RHAB|nr:hypothetical protein [Blattodean rhabdo-related virus OKIAV14]